ncbi:MAG: TetR family transcriptional regulator [Pseudomonadota bacterium]
MSRRGIAVDKGLILDAAERIFFLRGVSATSLEAVAAAAGVTRPTIYRNIGNRDALLLAVLVRLTERFLERLKPRLLAAEDLPEAIVLLIETTAMSASRDELNLIFGAEDEGQTGLPIPGVLAPLSELFGRVLKEMEEHLPGTLRSGVDYKEAGEWIIRLAISFTTIEVAPPHSSAKSKRLIRTYALPALVFVPEH